MKLNPVDIMFFAGMIAVFYFMFILPKKKEQQAFAKMIESLKKGDRVVTNSGMYGEIYAIKDNVITLSFHDGLRIDFDKSAIARAVTAQKEEVKA
jgi:preprotein translocase subunit YajC